VRGLGFWEREMSLGLEVETCGRWKLLKVWRRQ